MKILTIVGARPQFIKAASVSRELRKYYKEILIHTGQHYDKNMSRIFFDELEIPEPDYNLKVGSGSHGKQTGEMLIKIEEVLLKEQPDCVIVYGDTNSTIAGALAASKLHIPVIHVEAGLRSYNKKMPEEQNRVLTDHISSLLLCPTETAVENLKKEGITKGVYNVGDVMYDAVLYNMQLAEKKKSFYEYLNGLKIIKDLSNKNLLSAKVTEGEYYLATVHRAENTDSKEKVKTIFETLEELDIPVIVPLHPRTKKVIDKIYEKKFNNVYFIEPVGYLEMLMLAKYAKKVITDSGGLQKEAYFLGTPCVTLRGQTEWVETLNGNWNVLCDITREDIIDKIISNNIQYGYKDNQYFGDGNAAKKIVEVIKNTF